MCTVIYDWRSSLKILKIIVNHVQLITRTVFTEINAHPEINAH